MAEQQPVQTTSYPYATHRNVLFEHLQKVDVPSLVASCIAHGRPGNASF
jgi:hypothetical protein